MKAKLFIISTTLLIFLSCKSDSKKDLVGLWEEQWIGKTDVSYIDTLNIKLLNDSIVIELFNKQEGFEPIYSNVFYNGKELTFKMEVKELTNIYKFTLSNDKNRHIGGVENWQGKKKEVNLIKVKL